MSDSVGDIENVGVTVAEELFCDESEFADTVNSADSVRFERVLPLDIDTDVV